MKVLITGANGFIGRNLCQVLSERSDVEVVSYTRLNSVEALPSLLSGVEFVIHLAGVNRPIDSSQFETDNHTLTELLCAATARESDVKGRPIPMVFASSIQAQLNDSLYAQSKRAAEESVFAASREHGFPAHVFRLPNVFGKWCRPNYNSVVATFCWNVARGIPLEIHDPRSALSLVYIDDVVGRFVQLIDGRPPHRDGSGFELVEPRYQSTVGAIADHLRQFRDSRNTLEIGDVGAGFLRALYATYLSYLPEDDFAYLLNEHVDERGRFVEILRTARSGQFSYFTAAPGITRGGHYHHTKVEKFLVVRSRARFRFVHVQDHRTYEIVVDGKKPEIVETIPGWAHSITNIGDEELVVMLWASEVFDATRPDTYQHRT